MTTIETIKNECLGWTGLQSSTPQGQFAQRAAKAVLELITYVEKDTEDGEMSFTRHRGNSKLQQLRRDWEESK